MNDKKPLILDYKSFVESTRLDYAKGTYVSHPSPEAVLGENYSSTEHINSIQQMITYCLITGTKVDIGEIIYNDLDPSKVTEIELTASMIAVNKQKDLVSPLPFSGKKKKVKSQTVTPTLPKSQGPEASGAFSKKRQKPKSSPKRHPLRPRATWDKDSDGLKPPTDMELLTDMEPLTNLVVDPSGTGNGYSLKDKKRSQNRQNQAREWKEREKVKVKVKKSKSKSQQVKDKAETEEILN
ncbi:hypothetical protein Tco_1526131, partial [Tanacetum coccineum]